MRNLIRFTIIIFLFLCSPSWAVTTYYVDADAAGGGDGSLSTPWDELSDISGVGSGDTVKIRGTGREYNNESFTVVSGVTYTDWDGDSSNPIIGGAECTGWSQDSGNRYKATFTTHTFADQENSVYQDYEPLYGPVANAAAVDEEGEYYWDSGTDTLYVYCYDTGSGYDPSNYSMRVGQGTYRWINQTHADNVTFSYLSFVASGAGSSQINSDDVDANNDWTISNCTFRGSSGYYNALGGSCMIHLGSANNFNCSDSIFEHAGFYRKWKTAITDESDCIKISAPFGNADNIDIRRCVFRYFEHDGVELVCTDRSSYTMDDGIIRNNYFKYGTGALLNFSGGGQRNWIVEFNWFDEQSDFDAHCGVALKGENHHFRYNVIVNSDTHGLGVYSSGEYETKDCKIYNNTIADSDQYGIYVDRDGGAWPDPSGIELYGNIVYDNYDITYRQIVALYTSVTYSGCEYNYPYHSETAHIDEGWYYKGAIRTAATMYSLYGFEQYGSVENPLFVSESNKDYRLQSDSGCKDAISTHPIGTWEASPGAYPAALLWATYVDADYAELQGKSVKQGAAFDVGACEIQGYIGITLTGEGVITTGGTGSINLTAP